MNLDLEPNPAQRFVIGGWKRNCTVTCDGCGLVLIFSVYSEEVRSDEWCEQALRQTMRAHEWLPGDDDDYCPECCDQ